MRITSKTPFLTLQEALSFDSKDNTKQALLDTVNSSSSVLLQKLDVTQQDLLKQTKESHAVLEGVASQQSTLGKQARGSIYYERVI